MTEQEAYILSLRGQTPYGLVAQQPPSGLPDGGYGSSTQDVSGIPAEVKRANALAQLLRQQASSPLETNQMAGRFVVPVSPWQGVAKLAQGAMAGYTERKADEKEKTYNTARQEAMARALKGLEAGESPEIALAPLAQFEGTETLPLEYGLKSRMAEREAKIAAESDERKFSFQQARDEFRQAQQMERDNARYEQMDKRQQAQFAQAQAMQMRQFEQQMNMQARQLAAADERAARSQSGMKPPPGYRFTPEGNLEAIPGGPASTKAEIAAEKAQTAAVLAGSKADTVINMIDKGLEQTSAGTTGLKGAVLGQLPGTQSYDLKNTIDTVKANIGFKELSDMRAASPTGGALGQVAVKELDFLQASIASLNQGQSEAQLRENLNKVKTHYQNWKNIMQRAAEAQQGGASAPSQDSGVVDWNDLE